VYEFSGAFKREAGDAHARVITKSEPFFLVCFGLKSHARKKKLQFTFCSSSSFLKRSVV
jgi:hypothetical protein